MNKFEKHLVLTVIGLLILGFFTIAFFTGRMTEVEYIINSFIDYGFMAICLRFV